MDGPRKIVFILGNGFDLDMGLKTSYKDFWDSEFCCKDYPAPLIRHLNQHLKDNIDTVRWFDLENELLNYYSLIEDSGASYDIITKEEQQFLETFMPYKYAFGIYNSNQHIVDALFNKGIILFRDKQFPSIKVPYQEDLAQPAVWRDRKAYKLIKDGLCTYLKTLSEESDRTKACAAYVMLAISAVHHKGEFVNVYSFNYTPIPTVGRIINEKYKHYMHGNCASGNIIIGTRDDVSINKDYDFLQKSFDTNYNPPALVADLADADEIIVFGHSLGENDRQYFKPFFKKQSNYGESISKNITIFTRNEESKLEIKRALQNMTDGNLSTLYGRNNLRIIKTGELQSDYKEFISFLLRFFDNKQYVESLLSHLMNEN